MTIPPHLPPQWQNLTWRSRKLVLLFALQQLIIQRILTLHQLRKPLAVLISIAAISRLIYSFLPAHPLAPVLAIGLTASLFTILKTVSFPNLLIPFPIPFPLGKG